MADKKRLVNLDLLKIVAMVMIVSLHYLKFGGILDSVKVNNWSYYFVWMVEMLCIVAVNCYILCTGYLMTKNNFRISKIITIWLQVFCINIICAIIAVLLGVFEGNIFKVFLPISSNTYWYISAFFAFYLISPLLIYIVNKLSLSQLKKVVIISFLLFVINPVQWTSINSGYHFVWFIVLFFIAAYIRKGDVFKRSSGYYFLCYILFSLFFVAVKTIIDMVKINDNLFLRLNGLGYNSLFVFLSSLMLFAAFKNLKIGDNNSLSRIITALSSLTLGVYLIHINPYLKDWFWGEIVNSKAYIDKPVLILHFVLVVGFVYLVCSFLEYVRQLLFKFFSVEKFVNKVSEKINNIASLILHSDFFEKL